MATIVIIGCGNIGLRVAAVWRARGADVVGMVRSDSSAQQSREADIQPVIADLDTIDATALHALPAATVLYYFAPPPSEGTEDPRARRFFNAIDAAKLPGKVVLISTSAVYGDRKGAWVDETAPTNPQTARGWRRLDAEQTVRAWGRKHKVPVIVLRVPGIYGPGCLPLERLKQGLPILLESEAPYTNRIHADDLAACCLAAAERGVADNVYNVSDGQPGSMTQYFLAVADACGLPHPPQVTLDEAKKVLTPGMLDYLHESRRLDVRKMHEELNVQLRYPNLQEGLKAILAEEKQKRGMGA